MGQRGTVVDVSKGYLRNYLIPRKLAQPATKSSVAAAERHQKTLDRAAAEATQRAEANAELLNKTVLTIAHQAGDDGRLFGSVTSQDIVDAIKEARGLEIDKPQGAPRGADPHGRHPHGHRRGRRRRPRQRQDHGGRAVAPLPGTGRSAVAVPAPAPGAGNWAGAPSAALDGDGALADRLPRAHRRAAAAAASCSPAAAAGGERLRRTRRRARQGALRRGVAGAPGARTARRRLAPVPLLRHAGLQALVDLRARRAHARGAGRPPSRARSSRATRGPASRTR